MTAENECVEAQAKPLKAYMCTHDDSDGHATIVFAESPGKAKQEYCSQADAEYTDVRATRKPVFDQHSPGPVPVLELLEDGWWFECAGCSTRISFDGDQFIEDFNSEQIEEHYARQAPHILALEEFDRENPKPVQPSKDAPFSEHSEWHNAKDAYRRARERLSVMIIEPLLSRAGLRTDDARSTIYCSLQCEQKDLMQKALINHQHELAERTAAERWPGCPAYASKRYPYLNPSVAFRPEGLRYDARWNPEEDAVFVHPDDRQAWDSYITSRDAVLQNETAAA